MGVPYKISGRIKYVLVEFTLDEKYLFKEFYCKIAVYLVLRSDNMTMISFLHNKGGDKG